MEASRDGFSVFAGFARSGDRRGGSGSNEPASGCGQVWGQRGFGDQMGAALLKGAVRARRAEWRISASANSNPTVSFSKGCEQSDITLEALCDRLPAERGVKADTSIMSRFFRRIGITHKKKDAHCARAGSSGHKAPSRALARPPEAHRPIAACVHRRNLDQDQHDPPLQWAPRGRRLVAKAPHGHWKTATFLAGLRSDRIEAPCLFDGPINGERFLAYVEQFLVPTLKRNDIVVPHKGKAVRSAIKTAGARLLYYSFPNTRLISTRSSRSSPSSKASSGKLLPAHSTPSQTPSLKPSQPSRLKNAQTISKAKDASARMQKALSAIQPVVPLDQAPRTEYTHCRVPSERPWTTHMIDAAKFERFALHSTGSRDTIT